MDDNRKKQKKGGENDYYILDGTVYFRLKGRASDYYAMVSVDKWGLVRDYDWYLGCNGYPMSYQVRGKTLHRYLFRHILGEKPPPGWVVDHIDRNKLNNTNENLRLATIKENSYNRTPKSDSKGVKKIGEDNYQVTISKDGKKHVMKNIGTKEDARAIYDAMAEELFGEFAVLNIGKN